MGSVPGSFVQVPSTKDVLRRAFSENLSIMIVDSFGIFIEFHYIPDVVEPRQTIVGLLDVHYTLVCWEVALLDQDGSDSDSDWNFDHRSKSGQCIGKMILHSRDMCEGDAGEPGNQIIDQLMIWF